jgi:hypothetical protein
LSAIGVCRRQTAGAKSPLGCVLAGKRAVSQLRGRPRRDSNLRARLGRPADLRTPIRSTRRVAARVRVPGFSVRPMSWRAELVSLGIGQYSPGLCAGLTDVDPACPQRDKPLNLLVAVLGAAGQIEVHAVLDRLQAGNRHEAQGRHLSTSAGGGLYLPSTPWQVLRKARPRTFTEAQVFRCGGRGGSRAGRVNPATCCPSTRPTGWSLRSSEVLVTVPDRDPGQLGSGGDDQEGDGRNAVLAAAGQQGQDLDGRPRSRGSGIPPAWTTEAAVAAGPGSRAVHGRARTTCPVVVIPEVYIWWVAGQSGLHCFRGGPAIAATLPAVRRRRLPSEPGGPRHQSMRSACPPDLHEENARRNVSVWPGRALNRRQEPR